MSGETEASVSGWTVDTLREYLTQRIIDQGVALSRRMDDADKAISAALVSAEKAVTKAEMASDKRFEAVNEFRKTLADQTAGFIPRAEYDARHKSVVDKQEEQVRIITERIAALELRLTSRLDLSQGSSEGSAGTRTERREDDKYTQADRIAVGAQARATISLAIAAVATLITLTAVLYAVLHG